MKKQVFRLITFSLLLISTVLLWTNCQKDSSTESTPDFGDVDVAGKLHNEGLDFVIARLNYQSASNDRIFDATKDFMLVKHPDWANRKDFIDSRPSDKLDYLSTFSDETKGAITKLFTDLSKNEYPTEQVIFLA